MNKIQSKLELIEVRDIDKVMSIDARKLSSTVEKFCSANRLGYYLIINTWLMNIQAYSQFGWMRLWDRIHAEGLVSTIKACADAALEVVQHQPISDPICREMFKDIKHRHGVPIGSTAVNQAAVATGLFLFRYPKRFSPLEADKVESDSIHSFLDRENRTKLLMRRGYSVYVLDKVRNAMASLVNWDAVCAEVDKALSDPTNLVFTPGACYDSKSSLGSKLLAVQKSYPEFFVNPFGIPYSGGYPSVEEETWGRGEVVRKVRVAAVPKDYKSARIIAPEPVVRQGQAGVIADILSRHLPARIPLQDQAVNGALAKQGSIDGLTATIDLSAASDSISKLVFWEIFPYSFASRVYPFLGTHYECDGKTRLMQMMATSGNALTFILESLVFAAIDIAAEETVRAYNPDVPARSQAIPSVYGDDQVVWSCCYETTRDFLTALGFVVNEAKSYWEGDYRESCGEEWMNGIDCHTVYFPRFPIIGSITGKEQKTQISMEWRRDSRDNVLIDSLTSLVSLQHRLYGDCYESARFISEVIRDAFPKMTTSTPGGETPDCWEYEDTAIPACAPKAHVEYTRTKYGEITHRKLVNERSDVPRVKRFAPGVQYAVKGSIPPALARLYDIYKYQEFLKHGPRYDSDLDRMLGVTSKPRTIEEIYGSPEIVWRLRVTAE